MCIQLWTKLSREEIEQLSNVLWFLIFFSNWRYVILTIAIKLYKNIHMICKKLPLQKNTMKICFVEYVNISWNYNVTINFSLIYIHLDEGIQKVIEVNVKHCLPHLRSSWKPNLKSWGLTTSSLFRQPLMVCNYNSNQFMIFCSCLHMSLMNNFPHTRRVRTTPEGPGCILSKSPVLGQNISPINPNFHWLSN